MKVEIDPVIILIKLISFPMLSFPISVKSFAGDILKYSVEKELLIRWLFLMLWLTADAPWIGGGSCTKNKIFFMSVSSPLSFWWGI